MAYPVTIQELTGGNFNELSYNPSSEITGTFIDTVKTLLRKCDSTVNVTGSSYGLQMSQAIMEFQARVGGLQVSGILNNATWQTMIAYAEKYSDIIDGTAIDEDTGLTVGETSPHYDTFFDANNVKNHRRNGKDIKIVFGNNNITKTLKNVFMRSVSIEVDTSGNPISEVYEFVAQDVTETDEPMDANKYLGPESQLDLTINYTYGRVISN